jgi:hypothetical protein
MKRIDTRYYPKIESRAPARGRALRLAVDREGGLLAREAREALHLREARREEVAPAGE